MYVDRGSALLMQNWAHLMEIMGNINIMPAYESLKNSIDTIRNSFLEMKGRLFRQSIVFSEFNFPELNGLKRTHFHNVQGCATSKVIYQRPELPAPYDQQFFKIEVKEPKDDLELRFQYFKKKFWDDLHNKESLTKVVLFVSSYFEYVKLKTFLERVNASVAILLSRHNLSVSIRRRARCRVGWLASTKASSEFC
jgi:U3 small nucleolar RNA-associated protein 25